MLQKVERLAKGNVLRECVEAVGSEDRHLHKHGAARFLLHVAAQCCGRAYHLPKARDSAPLRLVEKEPERAKSKIKEGELLSCVALQYPGTSRRHYRIWDRRTRDRVRMSRRVRVVTGYASG